MAFVVLATSLAAAVAAVASLEVWAQLTSVAPFLVMVTSVYAFGVARRQGLARGGAFRWGVGRIAPWLWALGAWIGVPLVGAMGVAASVALGGYTVDLPELSGYRAHLEEVGMMAQVAATDLTTVVLIQIVVAVTAPLYAFPAILAEEVGFRGYLVGALQPAGRWVAAGVSAAAWAVWSVALAWVGGYPVRGTGDLVAVVASCLAFGLVLAGLRLRTDSLVAPWFARGAFFGTLNLPAVFAIADPPWSPAAAGMTGWPTTALFVVAGVALLAPPVRP